MLWVGLPSPVTGRQMDLKESLTPTMDLKESHMSVLFGGVWCEAEKCCPPGEESGLFHLTEVPPRDRTVQAALVQKCLQLWVEFKRWWRCFVELRLKKAAQLYSQQEGSLFETPLGPLCGVYMFSLWLFCGLGCILPPAQCQQGYAPASCDSAHGKAVTEQWWMEGKYHSKVWHSRNQLTFSKLSDVQQLGAMATISSHWLLTKTVE